MSPGQDDGAGDPVVKSVQVRPLTKMSATGVRQGTCEFVVPRAIGHYALLLMGNAAAESGLRRRPLKVVMGVHWRRRPWIKLRNAAGDVDAAVFALGSSLEAEWHFPLAQPDDAICIVGGRYTPRILHKDRDLRALFGWDSERCGLCESHVIALFSSAHKRCCTFVVAQAPTGVWTNLDKPTC